jgi:hypothetical protein
MDRKEDKKIDGIKMYPCSIKKDKPRRIRFYDIRTKETYYITPKKQYETGEAHKTKLKISREKNIPMRHIEAESI